jgi:hypothetical protein
LEQARPAFDAHGTEGIASAGAFLLLVKNAGNLSIGVFVQESVDLATHGFMSRTQLLRRQWARQSQRCGGAAAKAHRRCNHSLLNQSDILNKEPERAAAAKTADHASLAVPAFVSTDKSKIPSFAKYSEIIKSKNRSAISELLAPCDFSSDWANMVWSFSPFGLIVQFALDVCR